MFMEIWVCVRFLDVVAFVWVGCNFFRKILDLSIGIPCGFIFCLDPEIFGSK